MKELTKNQLRKYMISKNGKVSKTRPEQLFNEFQKSLGLGLVWDITLPFSHEGKRYDFQLDFARPTDSTFDIDFEIDGEKFHSSKIQMQKDDWKDSIKNRQGLKVIHIPAILCERVHWAYLAKEINRAILSTEGSIHIVD